MSWSSEGWGSGRRWRRVDDEMLPELRWGTCRASDMFGCEPEYLEVVAIVVVEGWGRGIVRQRLGVKRCDAEDDSIGRWNALSGGGYRGGSGGGGRN